MFNNKIDAFLGIIVKYLERDEIREGCGKLDQQNKGL